ncbi:GNAT family N-acetyltransferase [Marinifilum caeruleilacunae]|uniref:N-acetyltransferase n=1 Tax=Marinifilum caeruleilacunae TaxID=2499076 RepID=A0ABX1WZP5_9BACT|nr:GNAT family N-acetyltransferase [Marinifilum caeruleilacunae]NOU61381.1 N-acetyltransferase [Marinifilum caeruleilacunae]
MSQNCEFKTERLIVQDWQNQLSTATKQHVFAEKVIGILSPKVTEALPDGWQNINTIEKAEQWIQERSQEGIFSSVSLKSEEELIGFLFLYACVSEKQLIDMRFGYLLAESAWRKGFGTELIKGLLSWCEEQKNIRSLAGGVEKENIGSIKVMEKTGFTIAAESKASDAVIFYERKFL